jgi:hypothetical protein
MTENKNDLIDALEGFIREQLTVDNDRFLDITRRTLAKLIQDGKASAPATFAFGEEYGLTEGDEWAPEVQVWAAMILQGERL